GRPGLDWDSEETGDKSHDVTVNQFPPQHIPFALSLILTMQPCHSLGRAMARLHLPELCCWVTVRNSSSKSFGFTVNKVAESHLASTQSSTSSASLEILLFSFLGSGSHSALDNLHTVHEQLPIAVLKEDVLLAIRRAV
ncbi:hypothetical protein WG66_010091, partial [Moniliophthora roreri]